MGVQLATGPTPYGVALIGDFPGDDEVKYGKPFTGRAGFKFDRLLEYAGLSRSNFDIWHVCWCQPPDNKLEGTDYEAAACEYWKAQWKPLLSRVNVAVPMGNTALYALTGERSILTQRGYIRPHADSFAHLIPTVHPSFIVGGQSKYGAAFIHDVQHAVELSKSGLQPELVEYVLDPTPGVAFEWAKQYRRILSSVEGSGNPIRLAYDIETPDKGPDEGALAADDPTYFIHRISFAYEPLHALSVPWTGDYIGAIRLLLESSGEKVVWNKEFDNPRIRHNGVEINGTIHDGMVAWHILHSDLPKGLGFVATFTCPNQSAWKHLSHSSPAFYNATDSDVELRSFLRIEQDLKATGLWSVYQSDVLDLEPILQYMSQMGMPIDPVIREEKARLLSERLVSVTQEMSAAVPLAARRIDHVFVNTPKDTAGLCERPATRTGFACSNCGLPRPPKSHFKRFVKKNNPCADAGRVEQLVDVTEYYRLSPFTPSRDQLTRYHQHLGRPLPSKYDKKAGKKRVSFDEKALSKLTAKYPDDILYGLILKQRQLQKVGGTYIGYYQGNEG